jgi:hypothetical protein
VERVAFLIEETGEQLRGLLNPESLVLRRRTGVEPRELAGGLVAGAELADDPLICTGGGSTELDLDLLFDVSLAGSTVVSEDVRDLTAPLWDLAENTRYRGTYGHPPLVRFVWGKSWNIPGVVIAVAERLERFTPSGVPTRSWLRMRLRRVVEPPVTAAAPEVAAPLAALAEGLAPETIEQAAERAEAHVVSGLMGEGTAEGEVSEERLDRVSYEYYGDPGLWRLIAQFNGILDPLRLKAGTVLKLPRPGDLGSTP